MTYHRFGSEFPGRFFFFWGGGGVAIFKGGGKETPPLKGPSESHLDINLGGYNALKMEL